MSYHVERDVKFKDLPERILVREDGYMTAYVFQGEPIVDYWYVPEAENKKLRELAAEMYPYAKAFLQQGVMLGCTDSKSYDWYLQLREMGIGVDE